MRVMEPPVENIPVLTIQDPLAASGAVVLDCRPPLLPVSMDIIGVDLSAIRVPAVLAGVDVLPHEREPLFGGGGLAWINLSGAGTDVEDERPTPVGSPWPVVDGAVPLSAPSCVDMELTHVFLEVVVLLAMVTPVVDSEGESTMTPPLRSTQYPRFRSCLWLCRILWRRLLLLSRQRGVQ